MPTESCDTASNNPLIELLREVPRLWFDLDFDAFAANPPCVPVSTEPVPLRMAILHAAFSPDTTLAAWDVLAVQASAQRDADAAAMVCTAVIDRIINEGIKYDRLQEWLARVDALLDDGSSASAHARCALLLRRGLVAFVADCDIPATERFYEQQHAIAIELRSASQRLQYAAWRAFLDCQAGPLDRSDIVLTEALAICDEPGTPAVPCAMATSSLGMVRTLQGRFEDACDILRRACEAPRFQKLPPFLQSTLLCHRIYALAHTEHRDEAAAVANTLRRNTVPEHRAFLYGYLHFALGAAELRRKAPQRALLHAEQGERSCDQASSRLGAGMQALLRMQALSDLRREFEAFEVLKEWLPRWKARRMDRVAAVALLEKAHMHARLGELAIARNAYLAATRTLPQGDPLFPLHRDGEWLGRLRATILPTDWDGGRATDVPIRIRTLGTFAVEIDGRLIHDRDWRGRRGKALLHGLLAMGGEPISTEELADWIWPDSDGVQAQQNLKGVLWRLRRLGGEDAEPLNWIQVKQGRVTLPRSFCHVDAHEFQTVATAALAAGAIDPNAVQSALELYGGEFLPGESHPPIVIAFRRRLHELWSRLKEREAGPNRT